MIKRALLTLGILAVAVARCMSADEAPSLCAAYGVPGAAAAPAPPAATADTPPRNVLPSPSGYQTIHNDFFWTDQNGNRIATRSGCICQFGKEFYWYGGGAPGYDQTCYVSADTWSTGPTKAWCSARRLNRTAWTCSTTTSTRKYVMFLKYNGNAAFLGIATADKPEGPFTFKSQTLVDGYKIGDTSMFKDTDGKAYLCYVWDKPAPTASMASTSCPPII